MSLASSNAFPSFCTLCALVIETIDVPESPDNRERVTSGGGDKHVLASFLDLQNRVRRIERTIIHDNRSSRSATYTSRTASNMRILKPRENRVLSRFFLHASTHRKERFGAGRLSHENGRCKVALTFPNDSLIRQEDTLNCHSSFSRSEEHTSEPPSLIRISYAFLCLKKKTQQR